MPTSCVKEGPNNVLYVHTLRSLMPIGDLVCMESGYYEFFPDLSRGGCWSSWMLHQIADIVDAKNAGWDEQLREDLQRLDPDAT